MIYISHRGNINGKNTEKENTIDYITETINKGYNVEVDIWNVDKKWYLGHDKPTHEVNLEGYLQYNSNRIWFHCKNLDAYSNFLKKENENIYLYHYIFFWHQKDDFTLTSNNKIWTYPGKELCDFSICVLPETTNYTHDELKSCYGICSDCIEKYKNLYL